MRNAIQKKNEKNKRQMKKSVEKNQNEFYCWKEKPVLSQNLLAIQSILFHIVKGGSIGHQLHTMP